MLAAVVGIAILLLALVAGVPVAFSLGLAGTVGVFLAEGVDKVGFLTSAVVEYGTKWELTCLPLFILMGEIIAFTGLSGRLFTFVYRWVRVPGALPVGSILTCGIFAAISAGSTTSAATIGIFAVPEMLKRGVDRKLAAGAVAAGGTLGILIPPSGIMIIYCMLTMQSIGALFMAGFIPGLMMISLFSTYAIYRSIRGAKVGVLPPVSWKERLVSLRDASPVLSLVVFILGGMYSGVFTPTEVAGCAAFLALLMSIAFRQLSWTNLRQALLRTVQVTTFILFIIIGARMFGYFLTYLGVPQGLTAALVGLQVSPLAILVLIMAFLVVLGMFLDPASILVLTIPILFPVLSALGFDPIWFGILLVMNMEMGNLTPPVGLNLFVLKSVSPPEVTLGDVIWGSAPFTALLAVGVALVIAFPQLALWLPSTM